jgi:hypothetical protein
LANPDIGVTQIADRLGVSPAICHSDDDRDLRGGG